MKHTFYILAAEPLALCVAAAIRYEKVEMAKRAMRKKQELEKRFNNGEGPGSDSDEDDEDREDEDKITEQEEAGTAPLACKANLH